MKRARKIFSPKNTWLILFFVAAPRAFGAHSGDKPGGGGKEGGAEKHAECDDNIALPYKKYYDLIKANAVKDAAPETDPKKADELLKARLEKIAGISASESDYEIMNITPHRNEKSYGNIAPKSVADFEKYFAPDNKMPIDQQTNFGHAQISVDRFTLHPLFAMNALQMLFGKASPYDYAGFKTANANYFGKAREQFNAQAMGTLAQGFGGNAETGLINCGYTIKGNMLTAPTPGLSLPKADVVAALTNALKNATQEKLDILAKAKEAKAGDGRNQALADAVKPFGELLSLCPTLNTAFAYNEVMHGDYKGSGPEKANPWTPENKVVMAYFGPKHNNTPLACVGKI